jgi:hypothetical protein
MSWRRRAGRWPLLCPACCRPGRARRRGAACGTGAAQFRGAAVSARSTAGDEQRAMNTLAFNTARRFPHLHCTQLPRCDHPLLNRTARGDHRPSVNIPRCQLPAAGTATALAMAGGNELSGLLPRAAALLLLLAGAAVQAQLDASTTTCAIVIQNIGAGSPNGVATVSCAGGSPLPVVISKALETYAGSWQGRSRCRRGGRYRQAGGRSPPQLPLRAGGRSPTRERERPGGAAAACVPSAASAMRRGGRDATWSSLQPRASNWAQLRCRAARGRAIGACLARRRLNGGVSSRSAPRRAPPAPALRVQPSRSLETSRRRRPGHRAR